MDDEFPELPTSIVERNGPGGGARLASPRQPMTPRRPTCHSSRFRTRLTLCALSWLVTLPLVVASASAQSDHSDGAGDPGTSKVVEAGGVEPAAVATRPGEGSVAGILFDDESGAPVTGARVVLAFPAPGDGSAPRQEVAVTDAEGRYAFPSVPPGRYSLTFDKAGFRTSEMTDFEIEPGVVHKVDFPIPRLPSAAGGDEIFQLDAFEVEAGEFEDSVLELRMDSDAMLDVVGVADFSKYASNDVADALTRVAGVNVVEGQFAVIRGLEDRYSNTTFNGASVPSPDPERQSVQLDLFPTRVVSNLEVAKTFLPEAPGNSSAGSLNIVSTRYPEEFEMTFDAAIRINSLPLDGFDQLVDENPIGVPVSGIDALGGDVGGSLGGTREFGQRALRYSIVGAWKTDNAGQQGYQESREPLQGSALFPTLPQFNSTGDLALGILSLSNGRYTYERSDQESQWSLFGGLGVDLDEEGDHTLDLSIFYTDKQNEFVESWADGYFPDFDYGPLIEAGGEFNSGFYGSISTEGSWLNNDNRTDDGLGQNRGPLWFSNFNQGRSIARDRTLLITQLNGEHEVRPIEGLHIGWAANYARTTQEDTAYGAQYWFEPCGWSTTFACPAGTSRIPIPTVFPVTAQALGYGSYFAGGQTADFLFSALDVQEQQGFGRLDVEYERELSSRVVSTFTTGGWYEYATRAVDSQFFEGGVGVKSIPVQSAVPISELGLGASIFQPGGVIGLNGEFPDLAVAQVDQKRQIGAWYFGDKLTVLEDWDFLGGLRLESVALDTQGAPFRRGIAELDGTTQIYPAKYLFLDRVDRPRVPGDQGDQLSGPVPAGTVFNDQILNIPVQPDFSTTLCDAPAPAPPRGCVDLRTDAQIEDALTNDITEFAVLPAAGINYRPFDWWTIRTAYSQTLARPSFRELGYYASVEAGQTEVTVGNPYLELSPVQSVDGRFEFTWGEVGDLAAISGFYKTIENPIEATLVSSPVGRPDIARTFFNNPNTASLWGIELELRKTLDFLGWEFFEYWSVGGNGTYIDAEVARTEVELSRYANFFALNPRDAARATFSEIAPTRRLFGQPEWIANADLTFNHPGWGSRATLAYYAISDVLESVGAIRTADNGAIVRSLTLDRYLASFYTLDLILGQDLGHGLSIAFRALNLTDSIRGRVYDPSQTNVPIYERQFVVGRSYKITLSYQF